MADATILSIARAVTQPDLDSYFELQSVANGTGKCPVSALAWPIASGTFTIPSATAVLFTVDFQAGAVALPIVPSKIRLTKYIPTSTSNMFDAWVVLGWNNTSFQLAISGPAGDVLHEVFWEALP